jgi:hypothetical protein
MSLNLVLFIAVVVLVVGWFAAGTHYNVRKGEDALRWLQDGLPLIGEKTTLRWLGSSVVELKIQQARPPFRHAEVLVVLEPRDAAPVWAIARLRGRRDLFVFRATLNQRPRFELEARNPGLWNLAAAQKHDGWTALPAPAPLVALAPNPQPAASQLLDSMTTSALQPVRFTVHATEPNLEVQWRLDQLRKLESAVVFEHLRRVTELLR